MNVCQVERKNYKRTWRYLLDTAMSLKMGDFNTPSISYFLKKKMAALIVISKPP